MCRERLEAKKFILNIKEPFCITDLYYKLEKEGYTNRKMILQLLDELYDLGFIRYCRLHESKKTPYTNTDWAFIVNSL